MLHLPLYLSPFISKKMGYFFYKKYPKYLFIF
nr:MAG TPA: hypothetical protein [Caudoviricetes sp.]